MAKRPPIQTRVTVMRGKKVIQVTSHPTFTEAYEVYNMHADNPDLFKALRSTMKKEGAVNIERGDVRPPGWKTGWANKTFIFERIGK